MGNRATVVNKEGQPLSQVKDQMKSFDLILFRGTGAISNTLSKLQKLVIGEGEWSHVGIVITKDILDFENSEPNKLYIWESTSLSKTVDVPTGKIDCGIQIRDLEQVIDEYDNDPKTKIAWCQLKDNPINKLDDETDEEFNIRIEKIKEVILEFYENHKDDIYDYNVCSLTKSLYSWFPKWYHNKNMYFCSEMVMTIYQKIGKTSNDIDPESVAPVELVDNSIVKLPPVLITREW